MSANLSPGVTCTGCVCFLTYLYPWLLAVISWKVNPPLPLSLPGAVKLHTKGGKHSLWYYWWWTNALGQGLNFNNCKEIKAIYISHVNIIIIDFFSYQTAEEINMIQNQIAYYTINRELSSMNSVVTNFHWQIYFLFLSYINSNLGKNTFAWSTRILGTLISIKEHVFIKTK